MEIQEPKVQLRGGFSQFAAASLQKPNRRRRTEAATPPQRPLSVSVFARFRFGRGRNTTRIFRRTRQHREKETQNHKASDQSTNHCSLLSFRIGWVSGAPAVSGGRSGQYFERVLQVGESAVALELLPGAAANPYDRRGAKRIQLSPICQFVVQVKGQTFLGRSDFDLACPLASLPSSR